jgi:hypothetical protein
MEKQEKESLFEKRWFLGGCVLFCASFLAFAAWLYSARLLAFAIVHSSVMDPTGNRAVYAIRCRILGRYGAPVVPLLVDAFKDQTIDERARGRAIEALAFCRFGPEKGWKVMSPSPFIDALHDRSEQIRWWAGSYLRNFPQDAEVVVPALIDALKDRRVREDGVEALMEIIPRTESAELKESAKRAIEEFQAYRPPRCPDCGQEHD